MSGSNLIHEVQEFIVAPTGTVQCLALGQKSAEVMVTGDEDMKINFWALDRPNCLLRLTGHTAAIKTVKFNRTEKLVGSGCEAGVLKIWDLEAAKIMRNLTGHKSPILCMDFHPIGEFAATGAEDGSIKLWDLKRKGCLNTYRGHTGAVNCVQWSPDGKWLISADNAGVIKLWDVKEGKQLSEFLGHTECVTNLVFHPTHYILGSASLDGSVRFWDLDSQKPISDTKSIQPPLNHAQNVIRFHPDGYCLYGGGTSGLIDAFGWEPINCYHSLSVPFRKVADMAVVNNKLVVADVKGNIASTYIVDVDKLPPIAVVAACSSAERPSSELSGHGRRTFVAGDAVNPASKPSKKQQPIEDDEMRDNGVQINDPDYCRAMDNHVRLSRAQFGNKPAQAAAAGPAINARDFLPPIRDSMSQDVTSQEREALSSITQGHSTTMSQLASRHRRLQTIEDLWARKGSKNAIEMAVTFQDRATIVDLLNVLLSGTRLQWSLDIVLLLLPILVNMINNKFEYYVHITLSTFRYIVQSYGGTIKDILRLPPRQVQGDSYLREKHQKCLACFESLMRARSDLEVILNRHSGRLGDKVREIHSLLDQLKDGVPLF